MRWAIKHKSGRTLFVTSDEFVANNRKKMGWIVEEVKMTSREQFEAWIKEETGFDLWRTEYPMTEWMTSSINAIKQTLHGWHGRHRARQLRLNCQSRALQVISVLIYQHKHTMKLLKQSKTQA